MTLSALLLEYAIPLAVGFIGWQVSLRGSESNMTVYLGLMLMSSVPLYAWWGAAKEQRLASLVRKEDKFNREFEEAKAALHPPLVQLMVATNATGTEWVYVNMPPMRSSVMKDVCQRIV